MDRGWVTITRKSFPRSSIPRISFPRKWRGRARLLDRDEAGEESTCDIAVRVWSRQWNELSAVNAQFMSNGCNINNFPYFHKRRHSSCCAGTWRHCSNLLTVNGTDRCRFSLSIVVRISFTATPSGSRGCLCELLRNSMKTSLASVLIRPWHPSCKHCQNLPSWALRRYRYPSCDITGFLLLVTIVAILNNLR